MLFTGIQFFLKFSNLFFEIACGRKFSFLCLTLSDKSKVSHKKIKVDYYVRFEWFSFLILPQIKWPDTPEKRHNSPLLFFHMKIQIMIVDYIKKNFDFIHRQNFYRASKLTIKKYFSGIITGISLSQHVKLQISSIFHFDQAHQS